jgi:CheY-like chemotaxis protein
MINRFHDLANEVVALSADCQESTKMLCLSAGMNLFLSKPLKKSEFGRIILGRPTDTPRGDLTSLLTMYGTSVTPGNNSR